MFAHEKVMSLYELLLTETEQKFCRGDISPEIFRKALRKFTRVKPYKRHFKNSTIKIEIDTKQKKKKQDSVEELVIASDDENERVFKF